MAALAALGAPELIRSLTLVEPSIGSLVADLPEAAPLLAERIRALEEVRAAGPTERGVRLLLDHVRGEPGSLERMPPDLVS